MIKYLLVDHYNREGDWGVCQSLIFNTKEEAKIKAMQLLGYEITDLKNTGYTVTDATNKSLSELEKEYKAIDGHTLYYWEDFGDTIILCEYDRSSINYEEWIIQEIDVEF